MLPSGSPNGQSPALLWPGPPSPLRGQAAIQAYKSVSWSLCLQIQRSQFIVVVGGGSAGVEMAAEIKTEYPEKEVRLTPWL